MYKKIIRPLLFRLEAERAHKVAHTLLKVLSLQTVYALMPIHDTDPRLTQTLWNIPFRNPIGVAAGLDKNGEVIPGLASLGFGFVEIGTITPLPESGNNKPRVFRLPDDKAILNSLGFPNDGAEKIAQRLKHLSAPIPVGINIGKQKATPLDKAVTDYVKCAKLLSPFADFLVVNISSPNLPDLRKLQNFSFLKEVTLAIRAISSKPLLIKLDPDQDHTHLFMNISSLPVNGLVLCNTTTAFIGLKSPVSGTGGISGKPLFQRTKALVSQAYVQTKGKLPIIASGGVFTASDAYQLIKAGASLVEMYTALVYEGPKIAKKIQNELPNLLARDRFKLIAQAIGSAVKSKM